MAEVESIGSKIPENLISPAETLRGANRSVIVEDSVESPFHFLASKILKLSSDDWDHAYSIQVIRETLQLPFEKAMLVCEYTAIRDWTSTLSPTILNGNISFHPSRTIDAVRCVHPRLNVVLKTLMNYITRANVKNRSYRLG